MKNQRNFIERKSDFSEKKIKHTRIIKTLYNQHLKYWFEKIKLFYERI